MTRKEVYIKKICKYCKGKCNRGIVIFKNDSTICTKCVDYKKDESKIKGYKEQLKRTAKIEKCVMKGFISDWNKL